MTSLETIPTTSKHRILQLGHEVESSSTFFGISQMSAKVDFEFGPYRFDQGTGLTRNGAHVPIPPKEFALLQLLLRLDGRVASHRTIENEVL